MKRNNKTFVALLAIALMVSSCGNAQGNKNESNKQEVTQEKKGSKKMNVIHLTKSEFMKRVANLDNPAAGWKFLGDKPAIVDFYATWCGPCKQMSPILDEIAQEYEGKIDVYKVDVDKEPELSQIFNIRSVPTLLFAPKEGKPQIMAGALSYQDFKKVIAEVLIK
ncbi:MAG: thioredoxin [Prevotella sp.]|nr:thioredoxin [Prevotella sp.]